MKPLQEALQELKNAISTIDILTLFYNAILIFLCSALILLLLKLSWGLAFIPATLALFFITAKKTKQSKLLRAEETTPELQEKLRTAADNIDKDNEVVTLLSQEVIRDMKKIETAKFVDFKQLTTKGVLILALAFLCVTVAYLNVGLDLPDFGKRAIQEPLTLIKERVAGQDLPNINPHVDEGNISNILGNRSLALLGKKELLLQLNPVESEINLDEIKDPEKKDFSPPPYPKEIYTSYDISYNERIPKQNSKIIKNYFQEISR